MIKKGKMSFRNGIGCMILLLLFTSCVKFPKRQPDEPERPSYSAYMYPYNREVSNPVAEITLKTNSLVPVKDLKASIPHLKYNKTWLLLFTQDDCTHSAYSTTWAAIHGKPLSEQYYYNAAQLHNDDLPPGHYTLGKPLGSTDGAGNQVRFAFTTTLLPESTKMSEGVIISPGVTDNYFRFFKKNALVWDNVREILAFGSSIAFHNVAAADESVVSEITKHYAIAQDSILKYTSGRGCKVLAEPDGNKAYVTAAQAYAPIQILTAQAGTTTLYPYKVQGDLHKLLINRAFYEVPALKQEIGEQVKLPKEERKAIAVGVHATDHSWTEFLLWLNDTYGQDGDNSVWVPSLEEYYEYNYYRQHSSISFKQIDPNTIKMTITLPMLAYFYYPALTINIEGISQSQITVITSNDAVTGLSSASYGESGLMMNVDCRKFLPEHATHFVEQYEKNKSNRSNQTDAHYFVNLLKDSDKKRALLERVK